MLRANHCRPRLGALCEHHFGYLGVAACMHRFMKTFEGTWHIQEFSNATLRSIGTMHGQTSQPRHLFMPNPFGALQQSECCAAAVPRSTEQRGSNHAHLEVCCAVVVMRVKNLAPSPHHHSLPHASEPVAARVSIPERLRLPFPTAYDLHFQRLCFQLMTAYAFIFHTPRPLVPPSPAPLHACRVGLLPAADGLAGDAAAGHPAQAGSAAGA
eukprot:361970-Chlamydomonas_euryale.AAC.2